MSETTLVEVEWDIGPVDIIENNMNHGEGNWTLPNTMVQVPNEIIIKENKNEGDTVLADWLSDNYGWLVNGAAILDSEITTFDGVKHDKEELLEKMIDDDFYYGYLGEHALSSSTLKIILKSPKAYISSLENEDTGSQALTDGKLFHMSILEADKFEALPVVDVASKASKIYKEAKAEHGEVFTLKEINKAKALAEVFLRNKEVNEYLNNADFEVPQIQMIEGLPFRGKADVIKGNLIIDLKTTANINDFEYSALKFGYDLQAYLYLQLFPEAEQFVFICIDKTTKDIGIFECSNSFLESGRRKLKKGIKDYKHFFQTDLDLEQHTIKKTLNGRI